MALHEKIFEEKNFVPRDPPRVPRVHISGPHRGFFSKLEWPSRVWRSLPYQFQHWQISRQINKNSAKTRVLCVWNYQIKHLYVIMMQKTHLTELCTVCQWKILFTSLNFWYIDPVQDFSGPPDDSKFLPWFEYHASRHSAPQKEKNRKVSSPLQGPYLASRQMIYFAIHCLNFFIDIHQPKWNQSTPC